MVILNISGIDRLKHNFFCDREIIDITMAKRWGNESASYVFHFSAIPYSGLKNHLRYKQWEDEFEVHLCRYPKHNRYELFVMGLHGVTCQELELSDVQNFALFHTAMNIVIGRCKRYWEEN